MTTTRTMVLAILGTAVASTGITYMVLRGEGAKPAHTHVSHVTVTPKAITSKVTRPRPAVIKAAPTVTVTLGNWTGVKPSVIYFSGSGGDIFHATSWSGWGTSQAVAVGTVNIEGCVPNCAAGTETPTPATVVLGAIGSFGSTTSNITYRQYTSITEADSYMTGGGLSEPTSQVSGATA